MKILAIESSTHLGSIAITDGEKTLAERPVTKNAEELVPSFEEILKKTATSKNEIRGVAVSSGPGFFTSLKVGAAAAKSFAYALKIPIAPVPSLDILAASAKFEPGTTVCAAINARSGLFFWAVFREENGGFTRLCPDSVTTPDEMRKHLAEMDAGSVQGVLQEDGSGGADEIADFTIVSSKASVCASLGLRLMEEGKTETAFSFSPNYVRENLYS
ncbi:MAG: tRNA (adenosine(37)-N6)-threonylcarbamoyltransferase complex dimerization subunit type 1 TsaB [Candidatus Mycalebacterium zealandia]|nr:MAG: tRNA (adenosine(37)-N6)-threonylcarbamoyltransferase complex dimerization subunit type 1 TsaB [Candidatus Mycalebacterium zealandia]